MGCTGRWLCTPRGGDGAQCARASPGMRCGAVPAPALSTLRNPSLSATFTPSAPLPLRQPPCSAIFLSVSQVSCLQTSRLRVSSSRGTSARGTLATCGSSYRVLAAPRGTEALETPGIACKRPFPAPLRSRPQGQRGGISQETLGGRTQRVFLFLSRSRPAARSCPSSLENAGTLRKSLALPGFAGGRLEPCAAAPGARTLARR